MCFSLFFGGKGELTRVGGGSLRGKIYFIMQLLVGKLCTASPVSAAMPITMASPVTAALPVSASSDLTASPGLTVSTGLLALLVSAASNGCVGLTGLLALDRLLA